MPSAEGTPPIRGPNPPLQTHLTPLFYTQISSKCTPLQGLDMPKESKIKVAKPSAQQTKTQKSASKNGDVGTSASKKTL